MKTGDNQIQRGKHRASTVDFTVRIFNIGLDTTQNPDAIHQARPDAHIHKVPVVRRICHIRTVVGNRKKLNPFQFGLGDVVMKGAVRVGAGDGVHMQVNGIHLSLLWCFIQRIAGLPGVY
ncbi:hypothetical protein D3C71_1297390 [compost metagenome]